MSDTDYVLIDGQNDQRLDGKPNKRLVAACVRAGSGLVYAERDLRSGIWHLVEGPATGQRTRRDIRSVWLR